MSFIQIIAILKEGELLRKRDSAGKFAKGGKGERETEITPPPENETEEDRKQRAEKLRLASEQRKRRAALDEKQRARREVPEAKL